ncbi:MAG: sulfite exporter TauE/SafE family protein [Caldimicrobium sp.]
MFDFLLVEFPVAKIKTYIFLPPLFSLILSFFCATGGVSGAFLLLPFQLSVLGFTSPSVSATNHLYNVVAIPSGVYRYWREKRFYFPLTLLITLGTFPGVVIGYFLRISLFQNVKNFKLLVGMVLLFIGAKLFYDLLFPPKDLSFSPEAPTTHTFNFRNLIFEYGGRIYSLSTPLLIIISFVIGIVGGIYGIGGGAVIAPILLAFFHLPPYIFAGATLFATFLTSILGVIIYTLGGNGPDFLLGFLFGLGGAVGLYFGARFQKKFPQKLIRLILTVILLYISFQYIYQYLKA